MFLKKVIRSVEGKDIIPSLRIVDGNWAKLGLCQYINRLDRQDPKKQDCIIIR